jgi:hypothetical protein
MGERHREGSDGSRRESPARERAHPRARSGALRRQWRGAGRHVRTGGVRDGRGRLLGIGSLLDDGRERSRRMVSGLIVAGLVRLVNAKLASLVTRLDMERPPMCSVSTPSACTLHSSAVVADEMSGLRDGMSTFTLRGPQPCGRRCGQRRGRCVWSRSLPPGSSPLLPSTDRSGWLTLRHVPGRSTILRSDDPAMCRPGNWPPSGREPSFNRLASVNPVPMVSCPE